ncbi:MAG TPA: D-2-hydroxyacid dehydrogenase [Candidatus Acidoferrum sp.]|nr:D-2-hydroxyacid dehydrogenase [Candidatus Acidoferrum sp.]
MKIISTVALQPAHRAAILEAVPGAELADRQCRTVEEAAEFVSSGCDVMLTFRVPNDIAERARGLKWIQLLSAGADHVLGGPLKGSTIPITTTSGIHATPIAEYTLASMLAYGHRIHLALRAQIRREWMRSGAFMGSVDEIRGKTIGIIGYGSIGRETARLAAAFGMTVLALKRNPAERVDTGWYPAGVGDPDGSIPARFFGPDEREAILRESDYVSVTLPLTNHTRKFIGEREFAAMKPAAYIVNVGRGEVIDEHAMAAALTAARIGGAGLDVFEHEPLEASSPLWELENAILTPHISGGYRAYMDRACELFAENLKRFAANRPLLNVVDPNEGY